MNTYLRTWALDDISISRSGDGRTVTAYAAMFDAPYEVRDQHGHYMEQIERSAFNRTLSHGGASRVACLFNHGLTVHGTPDGKLSVPLGTPLEIKPDGRGLLTVTRYNRGEVADLVLESIRNGDIRSQSFRGRIFRSSPDRMPRQRGGALPTVVRHELGLSDYGPTPVPVNGAAEIVAVRSQVLQLAGELEHLDDDEREELLEELARHLSGRHNQGSHGNRFHTPGDRGSGLRRKGVERLTAGARKRENDGKTETKPAGRTFTNRELAGVLGNPLDRTGKRGTVNEHRQRLEDAGATREQSTQILKDLGVDVADDLDTFGKDPNDKRIVDFGDYEGPGRTLADRVDAEARDEAMARQQARLREATPGAYASLLGEGGQQALLKSKQQRAVFEAMRERGWVMTATGRGDTYVWSSPDGGERIELSLSERLGNKVRGFDGEREQSDPITWGKALEKVTGGERSPAGESSDASAPPALAPAAKTAATSPSAQAAVAAAPASVPDNTPLGGMSGEDQQRIRNAVADRGPEIFSSPLVGGSRSDVARYLAEGDLGRQLAGRHDGRTVEDAIRQVIDENPSLVERSPQQAKADAEARTARADALVAQAQQLVKSGDTARVADLLDQAYAIDPDHRLAGAGGSRSLGRPLSEIRDRIHNRLRAEREAARRSRDIAAELFGDEITATPADAGPGAEDSHQQVHSGRLSIRRNRIRAELISLGVIKP